MRDVVALVLLLCLASTACGEPPVAFDPPPRGPGQQLLDDAQILDAAIEERLREVSTATGSDVVGLTFTDERTSMGQADRGGKLLLDAWDADVVLVAVAAPGDFTSVEPDRRRFFGVFAADRFSVSRDLRERIIFDRVQLLAAENEWIPAFSAALDELEAELTDAGSG
jgi:hypothetical protein